MDDFLTTLYGYKSHKYLWEGTPTLQDIFNSVLKYTNSKNAELVCVFAEGSLDEIQY